LIPWARAARAALADKPGRKNRLAFAIFSTLEMHCEEFSGVKDADAIERVNRIWQMVREDGMADAMGFWYIVLAGVARARNVIPETSELTARNMAALRQREEWWQLGIGLLIEANWYGWGATYDREKLLEAAEIFQELGTLSERSTVEEMLGKVAFQQRRPLTEVLTHYNNARSFLQQMEGQSRPGHNLVHLADIYFQQGDYERAFSLFREEQRALERRGNMGPLAASLHWEALHAARYSTFEHARNARERSLALAQKLEHQSDIAFRQYELGEIYRIFGDLKRASDFYEQARTGFEKMNMILGLAFYQRAQGDIALQQQRYADALPYFQSYYSHAQEDNHEWSLAQAKSRIALTRAHLGEIDRARQEMHAVLAEIYAWRGDDLALQAMLTEPACLLHEGNKEAAIELASFLQDYHLSWNETKTYASRLVASAAIGLPKEAVQGAVERGKKLTFEDVMKAQSPGDHNVGSASVN
jgi:tetratricopeptide (TPR) repeat protein